MIIVLAVVRALFLRCIAFAGWRAQWYFLVSTRASRFLRFLMMRFLHLMHV
jgi:hypothetical protein